MKPISFFLSVAVCTGIMTSPLFADVAKGQKWYTKECKSCHGNGTKGAGMHTQDEWDELFGNDNEQIIKKHIGTPAEAYFKGESFKNRSKDIRDFLFEYGSDSGNVPAC
ncbi:c-type cytochrome [Sulfuricurvum sp.]|uniref:c-type cytochrome n=1 Tax=Sulfuricurvum sp. TaxID=2025608 RepID=UPI00260454C6|nr:c-type cytochrome [Sulfuricurvum sp.]MDD2780196.1 c-type cytochrome [Sulfuricurvum sp.]